MDAVKDWHTNPERILRILQNHWFGLYESYERFKKSIALETVNVCGLYPSFLEEAHKQFEKVVCEYCNNIFLYAKKHSLGMRIDLNIYGYSECQRWEVIVSCMERYKTID
jgi:hypothetical protein